MRISEIFNLKVSQYGLDFVDIDPSQDTNLYLNPHFLSARNDKWSKDAYRTIRSFFQYVIDLLATNNFPKAQKIFSFLGEPSETCLGMSRSGVKGSGVGPEFAYDILNSISKSKAVQSKLVQDLEDAVIFVEGVGKDRMSDITTNIIRGHLIEYTKRQCSNWNIPLTPSFPHPPVWDRQKKQWGYVHDDALIVDNQRLLLVPKWITSRYRKFNSDRYYRLPVVGFLQKEIKKKTGNKVPKKKINDNLSDYSKRYLGFKGGKTLKEYLREFTKRHPHIFDEFKVETKHESQPIGARDISHTVGEDTALNEVVDFLIDELGNTDPGKQDADKYHRLIAAILELIFYPDLIDPDVETNIHDGRKRVDITFENASRGGFFEDLVHIDQTPAVYIYVECKNYSNDPKNPEIDQLTGRFDMKFGKFGLLLCRDVNDMRTLMKRCSDAYHSKKDLVVPIVDSDIIDMLEEVKNTYIDDPDERVFDDLLRNRAKSIRLRDYT